MNTNRKDSSMSDNKFSQCEMNQLHIDPYLDGELESDRLLEFEQHLTACASCRAELEYAQVLHRAVVTLPRLDCADTALEPVHRMLAANNTQSQTSSKHTRWWDHWRDAFRGTPAYLRYAIPAIAVFAIGAGLSFNWQQSVTGSPAADLASNSATADSPAPVYTEAEIRQALADLTLAMDYLENVTQRTSTMVRDRFVLQQLNESINASFRAREEEPRLSRVRADGPI